MKKVIRSNDEIEIIYRKYNNMMYRICFAYMKNVPEAEDMVSDTFVQLIKKAPYFENAEHEKAWLIRVATNLCKIGVGATSYSDDFPGVDYSGETVVRNGREFWLVNSTEFEGGWLNKMVYWQEMFIHFLSDIRRWMKKR